MDRKRERERLRNLAWWMDERFLIPGLNRRIGLDGLVGLIPGVGDTATLMMSAYIVSQAARMGAPSWVLRRMIANVAVDYAVGLVPVAGDLFDMAFKANRRNIDLLDRWLAEEVDEEPPMKTINPDGTEWQEPPRRRHWG